MAILCPCGSSDSLDNCCGPYLSGQKTAPTAETLMRSRYTAYTMVAVPYLLQTTHPTVRAHYSAKEIESWAKSSRWLQLEVLATTAGKALDTKGEVRFKAHYLDAQGKKHIHHEHSYFSKELGKWYYVRGIIN